jgi:hypothetical protein
MKKLLTILTFVFAMSSTSCAGWIAQFKDNPVLVLQTDLMYINTAVTLAQGAFGIFAAADPADAANVQVQFNAIIARIHQAEAVAEDALNAAAAAGGPTPNPSALLVDAKAAVTDLESLLSSLPTSSSAAAAAALPSPEMQAAIAALEKAAHL